MSKEDLHDGYIGIIRKKNIMQMGTVLDPSKITVGQVRRLVQVGEFTEDSPEQMTGEMYNFSVSTTVDAGHSDEFIRSHFQHFKKILKDAGIIKKPLLCPVKIPILPHHRL